MNQSHDIHRKLNYKGGDMGVYGKLFEEIWCLCAIGSTSINHC